MEMIMKLIGMFTGKASRGQQASMLGPLAGMLGGGGLASILGKFQSEGLGDKLDSFTGSGQNARLKPAEVTQVLGADKVSQIAREAGVSERAARGGLANMLPGVLDKLSPNGSLPEGDDLGSALGGLAGKLGLG